MMKSHTKVTVMNTTVEDILYRMGRYAWQDIRSGVTSPVHQEFVGDCSGVDVSRIDWAD